MLPIPKGVRMSREFYVAYKEENPLVKSRPWAFLIQVNPESPRGRNGITESSRSGFRTKKEAQESADAYRRVAEFYGMD